MQETLLKIDKKQSSEMLKARFKKTKKLYLNPGNHVWDRTMHRIYVNDLETLIYCQKQTSIGQINFFKNYTNQFFLVLD